MNVVGRFIVKAKKSGLMEGDYAWFQYTDFASKAIFQPWMVTNAYNGSDSAYRMTALYTLNVVSRDWPAFATGLHDMLTAACHISLAAPSRYKPFRSGMQLQPAVSKVRKRLIARRTIASVM